MKCPDCGCEMERGFLQGMNRIAFVRRKHRVSLLPGQGEILLENHAAGDSLLAAQICRNCKKIVVDYSDKEVQEG